MSMLKQKEPLFTEATGLLASWSHPHHLTNSTSLSFSYGEVPIHANEGASSTALNSTYWDHSRVT